MRFKEGPTPSVAQKEIESILAEVELSQIDLRSASAANVPRATWIGHATVLVQYQGINFLTDPHLTDYAAPVDFWQSVSRRRPLLLRKCRRLILLLFRTIIMTIWIPAPSICLEIP